MQNILQIVTNKKGWGAVAISAALAFAGSPVNAAGIRFIIDTPTGAPGLAAQAAADQLAKQVNNQLPDTASEERLAGIGNAVAISQAGTGVNYAPGPKIAIIGTGLSLGINTGSGSLSDITSDPTLVTGLAYQTSFMGGINLGIIPGLPSLGPIDLNNMKVYVSYFSSSVPTGIESLFGIGGSFRNIGLHLQYQLLPDVSLIAVSWAGIRLTTGFTNTKSDFYITKDFTETYSSGTETLKWDGTAKLGTSANVTTIPFEVSTGVKVAIISLFGGFGVDIHTGKVENKLTASGPITGTTSGTPVTGHAVLEGVESVSPDAFGARIFGGVQMNIFMLKLLAQANADLVTSSSSFFMAARIAF